MFLLLSLMVFPSHFGADTCQSATLHIRKDHTAFVELEDHCFDVEYIDHSKDCPCMEYVIEPRKP